MKLIFQIHLQTYVSMGEGGRAIGRKGERKKGRSETGRVIAPLEQKNLENLNIKPPYIVIQQQSRTCAFMHPLVIEQHVCIVLSQRERESCLLVSFTQFSILL